MGPLGAVVHLTKRLSALRLFRREEHVRGPWQIIGWWEARRIPYNSFVGATGILTGLSMLGCALVAERLLGEPVGWPDPPIVALLGVLAYGFMANVCYTGGWVSELLALEVWGEGARGFGPIAFLFGFVFSICLTLVPAAIVAMLVVMRLALHALSVGLD